MAKKAKNLLTENERLSRLNRKLREQLKEAGKSFQALQSGTVDALVIADRKLLKVYTEKTADRIYRILIEKMNEGAVTLDSQGTILYCNAYFANMIKSPLYKVIGGKFHTLIENSSKESFKDLLKQAGKIATKTELCLYTSSGKTVPVLLAMTGLTLETTFSISVIVTDLTLPNKNQEKLKRRTIQLEEKHKELENAYKELTSFTYISSHDLQEPLRKIQNFSLAILLEEEKNLSDTGKEYFQKMRQTAMRMQSLIEDLLTYSRAKAGNRIYELTDLNLILGEVLKELEEEINDKKAVIRAKRLATIKAVPYHLKQVFQNLIGNSLKFSNPGKPPEIDIRSETVPGDKKVHVELSRQKKYVHLIFSDNGIGFEPQYKDRIFEVFQRLHTGDKYKGTGIGLAIVKRIVENHKGVVTATGDPGKGTRIDIYLPIDPPQFDD